MSYSGSRRHGRTSNLFSSVSPTRRRGRREFDDELALEEEIVDRALRIERRREELFRQQFHFLVSNVKELERRRHHRRERTHSPRYDRSLFRERRRRPDSVAFQIRMVYRGDRRTKHGEEILILQRRNIVFKGFLKRDETFTFRLRSSDDGENIEPVELEIFLDEFRLDTFLLDLQNGELDPPTDLLRVETVHPHPFDSKATNDDEEEKPKKPAPKRSSTVVPPATRPKAKEENGERTARPASSSTNSNAQRSVPRANPSARSTPPVQLDSSRSTLNSQKKTTPTKKSDQEDEEQRPEKKETAKPKATYGPPQLSTFVRSDSDLATSDDDGERKAKSKGEETKPNEEKSVVKKSDGANGAEKNENEGEGEADEEESGGERTGLNFLQLLQAMTGGSIRIGSSGDDNDGIQSLLTRLGMGNDANQKHKSTNVTPRECGNVENYLLVYLDKSTDDRGLEKRFRALVNYVKLFDDPDDCLALINSISNEKVIFVVTDELGDPVVSRIQDLQQVFKIYILCENDEQAENWSTNQPKIRGVYTDLEEVLQQIRLDIDEDEEDLLSFTIGRREQNIKDQPDFLLDQIVKEILLDPDEMAEAKKELLDFARQEYQNNDEQLAQIQSFEEHFDKENPLEFYQNRSFIHKMLKKAFRIPEVDVLFKVRLFIQSLHQLIISSSRDPSVKKVYRTRKFTSSQVEDLKRLGEGNFLSFSHFFVASKEVPERRLRPADDAENENENEDEEILFEIELGQSQNQMSLDEEHLLFTFGVVTRVEAIGKDEVGRTKIQVKVLPADDQQIEQLIEPIRKEIRAPYPSLRLVKFFIELEEYSRAVLLGQALLADWEGAKKDHLLALARIYHSLGTILYEKELYDQALGVIKTSHSVYLRFLPEDSPQLSPTWNNMGSIYLRQGKTELALEHHERALAIQLKSPSPDLASIISYSNNIGGVYLKLERYDEALLHFKRAVQIEEQTLPKNHPELAGSYHRIGGVYFRQNNFEKALEFYDKTLEIELIALPANHPTIAVTYHNRGTAFEGLGRLDEAVEAAEKAVEQLLKTLPKENPQVRMNQAYVDRLKQKLWVKQLFSSDASSSS